MSIGKALNHFKHSQKAIDKISEVINSTSPQVWVSSIYSFLPCISRRTQNRQSVSLPSPDATICLHFHQIQNATRLPGGCGNTAKAAEKSFPSSVCLHFKAARVKGVKWWTTSFVCANTQTVLRHWLRNLDTTFEFFHQLTFHTYCTQKCIALWVKDDWLLSKCWTKRFLWSASFLD